MRHTAHHSITPSYLTTLGTTATAKAHPSSLSSLSTTSFNPPATTTEILKTTWVTYLTTIESSNNSIQQNATATYTTERPKKIARSLTTISPNVSKIDTTSGARVKNRLFKNLLRLWLSMETLHEANITLTDDLETIHTLNPININYNNFSYLGI